MRFQGRTALITGSSKGIGRTAAFRLAEEGGAVAVNGRDAAAVDAVVGVGGGSRVSVNQVLATL